MGSANRERKLKIVRQNDLCHRLLSCSRRSTVKMLSSGSLELGLGMYANKHLPLLYSIHSFVLYLATPSTLVLSCVVLKLRRSPCGNRSQSGEHEEVVKNV
ncbi:hypothetical protein CEXT_147251 [Caerostris extrusa]|uniref:Uncharacterized protein n=1 Tax=Caerostris extrusa TaxID=172846 RepID=A0AAV4SXH7_CAEEX|nr:hypothetical protein CEXT_147251 [Caerostris extrusa]